ncbi:MAG: hypothetical protein QOE82_3202, partial [Thermoanaerobaculia bacterium]|nr:hypothetical protein [Thermoanaerobaculia bacterium]
ITEVTNVEELVRELRTRERARIASQDRELNSAIHLGTPVRKGPSAWQIPVNATPPISATYSVVCTTTAGQISPSEGVWTASGANPVFLDITCECSTDCPPPTVIIQEIRRSAKIVRRANPRALD